MQNQNPYERIYINPTNQTQVIPQTNIQQGQPQANYAYYVEQQPNQQQQVLIYQPVIDQVPIIDNPNLIKYQSNLVKKQFSIGATLINWIQQIVMCTVSILEATSYTYYYLYPYQLGILITITLACVIYSKFSKPPKNQALQILIQIGMTILYMLVAMGITEFVYPYSGFYCSMLVFHFMAYLAILIAIVNKTHAESLSKRFAIVNFQVIFIIDFILGVALLVSGDMYAILIIYQIVIYSLIVYGWSLAFGMIYIYGLEKLVAGQCNLEKTAKFSAATIVYGNLIIIC